MVRSFELLNYFNKTLVKQALCNGRTCGRGRVRNMLRQSLASKCSLFGMPRTELPKCFPSGLPGSLGAERPGPLLPALPTAGAKDSLLGKFDRGPPKQSRARDARNPKKLGKNGKKMLVVSRAVPSHAGSRRAPCAALPARGHTARARGRET